MKAKRKMFDEARVMDLVVIASSADDLARARATGEFETMATDEQAQLIGETITLRLRIILDEVSDVRQCTRAEAAEAIVSALEQIVEAEPTR